MKGRSKTVETRQIILSFRFLGSRSPIGNPRPSFASRLHVGEVRRAAAMCLHNLSIDSNSFPQWFSTHFLSRSKEFLAQLAKETLDRFDKLSARNVRVVQVDILQHGVHPLDLGGLLVLLDDHHLWVPLALLGIPTILQALEQAVLIPSQLGANLLELPAGDHSIFTIVVLVLRISQVLCAQSAKAKL